MNFGTLFVLIDQYITNEGHTYLVLRIMQSIMSSDQTFVEENFGRKAASAP